MNGFAASLMMVQQGLGYAISTYPPVQGEIEAGRVVGIPITSPSCEVQLSLIHRRDRSLGGTREALQIRVRGGQPKYRAIAVLAPSFRLKAQERSVQLCRNEKARIAKLFLSGAAHHRMLGQTTIRKSGSRRLGG
jgi:hypothetical protein